MYNNLTRTFLACDTYDFFGLYLKNIGNIQMEPLDLLLLTSIILFVMSIFAFPVHKSCIYLPMFFNKVYSSLEWCLNSPPKPHAFASLPLQSKLTIELGSIIFWCKNVFIKAVIISLAGFALKYAISYWYNIDIFKECYSIISLSCFMALSIITALVKRKFKTFLGFLIEVSTTFLVAFMFRVFINTYSSAFTEYIDGILEANMWICDPLFYVYASLIIIGTLLWEIISNQIPLGIDGVEICYSLDGRIPTLFGMDDNSGNVNTSSAEGSNTVQQSSSTGKGKRKADTVTGVYEGQSRAKITKRSSSPESVSSDSSIEYPWKSSTLTTEPFGYGSYSFDLSSSKTVANDLDNAVHDMAVKKSLTKSGKTKQTITMANLKLTNTPVHQALIFMLGEPEDPDLLALKRKLKSANLTEVNRAVLWDGYPSGRKLGKDTTTISNKLIDHVRKF